MRRDEFYPHIEIHTEANRPWETTVTIDGVPVKGVIRYSVEQDGTHNKPVVTLVLQADIDVSGMAEGIIRFPLVAGKWGLVLKMDDGEDT